MRLKYYLRGVGIGIIVTTIIFMISITLHKNETDPQNTAADNDKSTTISEAEKNIQPTETEEMDTGKKDTGQSDVSGSDSEKSDPVKTNTNSSDKEAPAEDTTKNTKTNHASEQQKSADGETESDSRQKEKVRFEISGGEFSDTICRKLKTAGLIDDAEAFNAYLIEKDYDNMILPGVYEIPKDSTYDEIAVLLTTKVE